MSPFHVPSTIAALALVAGLAAAQTDSCRNTNDAYCARFTASECSTFSLDAACQLLCGVCTPSTPALMRVARQPGGQNPSIKTENGNFVFSVSGADKHVTVKTSDTGAFNIDELPASITDLWTAMSSNNTELSDLIETKATLSIQNTLVVLQQEAQTERQAMDTRINALLTAVSSMESNHTELSDLVDTKATLSIQNTLVALQQEIVANMTTAQTEREAMDTRINALSTAMSSMDTELYNSIDMLEANKANFSNQNALVMKQQEIIANMTTARAGREGMAARIAKIARQNRHAGVNLLDGADLNDVTNSWNLDEANAEYDTFVDGLPIRVTTARNITCNGGTGVSPTVEVDHRKTYEFSVWMKNDIDASQATNSHFGFYLYDSTGSRMTGPEPVASGARTYDDPYFASAEKGGSEWHKEVGYLIGTDMINLATTDGISQIERSSMFFLLRNDARKALLRFGNCATNSGVGDQTKYTLPVIRELDMARSQLGAGLGNLDSWGSTESNTQTAQDDLVHHNLVRHADLLDTSQGALQVAAYGGDRWTTPVCAGCLRFSVFDGLGYPLPIISSVSREFSSGTGGVACFIPGFTPPSSTPDYNPNGWGLTNYIKVQLDRHYEFSIWIKSTDPGMANYFGLNMFDSNYNPVDVPGRTEIAATFFSPAIYPGFPALRFQNFKCNLKGDAEGWRQWKGYLIPPSADQKLANPNCNKKFQVPNSVGQGWATFKFAPTVQYVQLRYGSCFSDGNAEGATEYAFPSVRMIEGVN